MRYRRVIGAVTRQLGRSMQRRVKLGAAFIMLPIFGALAACAPADQEECRAEAATKAPTQAGLEELLLLCEEQFPARRALGGGYEYNGFPVAGPVPTAAELRAMRESPPEATEGPMTEAEAFVDAHALNRPARNEAETTQPEGFPMNSEIGREWQPGGAFYEHNRRLLEER